MTMAAFDNDSDGQHRIAVLGASVSAQTIDHQTREPVGYVEVLQRQHLNELNAAKITQFCYPGNRASDGGLIKVREVADSDTTICIFEPLIEELKRGVYATREEVLFVYRELLKAKIYVVVYFCVHPSKRRPEDFEQHGLHRDICDTLGIPIIEANMASVTDIGATYRGIHTRLPGARMYARQIVDAWQKLDLSPTALDRFFSTLLLPETPIRVGRFRYRETGDTDRVVIRGRRQVSKDRKFRLRVIQPQQIGPFSPVMDVFLLIHDGTSWHKSRIENSIWDPYCHYERRSYVVLFDGWVADCRAFEIDIRKSKRDPAYSTVRHPVESWPELSARTMRPQGDIYAISDEAITLEVIESSTGTRELDDAVPDLRAANDLMRRGEFSRAAQMYAQLLENGFFTSSLLVNLCLAQKRAAATERKVGPTHSSAIEQQVVSVGSEAQGRWINMTAHDWRAVTLRCELGARYPVLSVVVPCYNSGRLLKNALVRMIAARSIPFEVIIVDDGSTDGSLSLLEDLSNRYANIRVMSQTNKGAGAARNLAIPHCNGIYTFFLDADDEMDMGAVSEAVVHAIVNKRDLVFLAYRIFYDESRVCQPMYPEDNACFQMAGKTDDQQELQRLASSLTGFPWNRIVATALLRQAQILFCETRVHNDMRFHWQTIAVSRSMDFWRNAVCTHKKFSSGSLSSNRGKRRLEVFDAMRDTYAVMKDHPVFDRNRDVWDRICQKTLCWNRRIISEEVAGAFDAALAVFKTQGVVETWFSPSSGETALSSELSSEMSKTPLLHQTLHVPASVRDALGAEVHRWLPGEVQTMHEKVRSLIFSDARDITIDGNLVRDIIELSAKLSETDVGEIKKLIALLRFDMRELTQ